jgi:hypothetical protein
VAQRPEDALARAVERIRKVREETAKIAEETLARREREREQAQEQERR